MTHYEIDKNAPGDDHLGALGYPTITQEDLGGEPIDLDNEQVIGRDIAGVRLESQGAIYEMDGQEYMADLIVLEDGSEFSVPQLSVAGKILGIDEAWRD